MGVLDDSSNSSDSNSTCPSQPSLITDAEPFSSGVTLHSVFKYTSAGCAGVTTILCVLLILMHLRHYTIPNEQRQIIRMVFAPVVFAFLSMGSIFYYPAAIDLDSIRDVYEGVALCSLFLLFVNIVAPDERNRDKYFHHLERRGRKRKPIEGGSLKWYNRIWFQVFQLPITRSILMVATIATEAASIYCPTSNSVHHAHIWLRTLSTAAVVIAVPAILRFYSREKATLKPHNAFTKLVAFKAIVLLNAVQSMVFSFLNSGGDLDGGMHASYGDLAYGLPAFIFSLECVIFALVFQYAFRASEYAGEARQMGFFTAILDALSPYDLFMALMRLPVAFGICCGGGRSKHLKREPSYTGATYLESVQQQGGFGQQQQQPPTPQYIGTQQQVGWGPGVYGESPSAPRLAPSSGESSESSGCYYPREVV